MLGPRTSLLLLVLGSTACAGLRHPTAADVLRAQAEWPDTSLDELEAGRDAYVRTCAGCHPLVRPETRSAAAMRASLDRMESEHRVRLSPEVQRIIERYLVTAAGS